MPMERRTRLVLNGQDLLTIQASPVHLYDWAVGFLYTEGFIRSTAEIHALTVDEAAAEVHAEIAPNLLEDRDLAGQRYLTSGCGKGVTFSSIKDAMTLTPIRHGLVLDTPRLVSWMRFMQRQTPLYEESGGMHAAAAVHVGTGEMLVREDIGRHNAVDKALGAALQAGFAGEQTVLLTTGRISYEMCAKLARYGIAVGASLTAATDQAIRLANRLGIDLVGYAKREDKLVLYTEGRHIEAGAP